MASPASPAPPGDGKNSCVRFKDGHGFSCLVKVIWRRACGIFYISFIECLPPRSTLIEMETGCVCKICRQGSCEAS